MMMMMMMIRQLSSRRARLLMVVGVATVAGSAATALATQTVGPTAATPVGSGVSVAQIQTVQVGQRQAFSIFRRSVTRADVMPQATRRLLGETEVTGKNLDLARAVPTPDGKAWAIPGNGYVCLALPDPVDGLGLTCNRTAAAAVTGAINMLVPGDGSRRVLLGLIVPDGSSVEATFDDGHAEPLTASDGVVVKVLKDARSVTVTTARDVQHYDIPVPPATPTALK